MIPKYPIFIPSYSRAKIGTTAKHFDKWNIFFRFIVEKEQYDEYVEVWGGERVLKLPDRYHDEYDTFDNLGTSKSQGPGPARNFAWDISMKEGFDWHWVMDDNISYFYHYNNNQLIKVDDATMFYCMEQFCNRYENVVMGGPNYFMFIARKSKYPPVIFNTRIYSCNLIRNDVPYRWRGRYNEDTDLSLRMLKDGYCTIQFNAFIQEKLPTQHMEGGNTERFYSVEGTIPKSEMLRRMHPDVTQVVWRFNRWHHFVDYTPFKRNKLVKKKDIVFDNVDLKIVNI